jgi:molecular chaperone GrpE
MENDKIKSELENNTENKSESTNTNTNSNSNSINEQQINNEQQNNNSSTDSFNNNESANQESQEKNELIKKIETLEQQLAELNDKHIRLLAEFDNFRKRTRKEKEYLIKYAGEEIWKSILPILDDFERAIKENATATDIEVVKKGFEIIHNKFKHIISQNNIVPIDSLHKEFNADIMEAVAKVPAHSEELKGKVIEELEKAYQMNDKLIRHAKVVVGE